VVGKDTGLLALLENKGLLQEADILEKYGVDSLFGRSFFLLSLFLL
jgi:hypothetical protein